MRGHQWTLVGGVQNNKVAQVAVACGLERRSPELGNPPGAVSWVQVGEAKETWMWEKGREEGQLTGHQVIDLPARK